MSADPRPPEGRASLSPRDRLCYGVGGVTDAWGINGLKVTWIPVLGVVLGMNPAALGVIIAITRFFDAFTDPLMGWISDGWNGRWGRRRPFIAAGALACGVVFPLIWMVPPDWSPEGRYAWVLATALLYYAAFTVFTVPYHALGYELTPDYHGKTLVFASRTVFVQIVSFGSGWVFALVQGGLLGAPSESALVVGVGIGVIIALCGLVPAWGLRGSRAPATSATGERARPGLGESFRAAVRNRQFLLLLVTIALIAVTYNATGTLATYVSIYYTLGGEKAAGAAFLGWSSTIWGGLALASVPVVAAAARRFGKRDTLLACLAFAATGCGVRWFLFTPAVPWLQILDPIFFAPTLTALFLLAESMIADVCQVERWRSGARVEGMFGAVFAWVYKAGQATGLLLSGFALQWTGFDPELGGGQAASTFFWMRLLLCALPASALLGALFMLRRYALDAKTMAGVRAELAARGEGD